MRRANSNNNSNMIIINKIYIDNFNTTLALGTLILLLSERKYY